MNIIPHSIAIFFHEFKLIVINPETILNSLTREVKEINSEGKEVTKHVPALSKEVKYVLVKNIRRRMTLQPLNIRAYIETRCFQFDGVLHIKQQHFSEEPVLESSQDHDGLLESVISFSEKKPRASNKDGHSKIYTTRAPRDRRVRLSIDISRKFFCLQDLLGYDKASKTLDWLFTKCKTAIKELVEETNHCPSSTAYYQSKMSFLEAIMVGKDNSKKKSELKYDGKRKKMTQKPTGGFQDISTTDQSRAVARARARERVREKMPMNKLDELKTFVHDDFYYQNFKSSAGENHWVTSADPAAWWSLTGSTSNK
ncbi:hypothetical protein L1887_36406 [Cichorium endivia]|nr:hypothetical protein L1887_36406 [Cichorium endivia]